jgi:hypothetical protein
LNDPGLEVLEMGKADFVLPPDFPAVDADVFSKVKVPSVEKYPPDIDFLWDEVKANAGLVKKEQTSKYVNYVRLQADIPNEKTGVRVIFEGSPGDLTGGEITKEFCFEAQAVGVWFVAMKRVFMGNSVYTKVNCSIL